MMIVQTTFVRVSHCFQMYYIYSRPDARSRVNAPRRIADGVP